MEWRYKTVHYAVKKDGLLGGSFLDEEEMEASLNDYGEQGWELISLLEVRDGVVAVFKQEKDLFQGGALAETVPDKSDDCLGDMGILEGDARVRSVHSVHPPEQKRCEGEAEDYSATALTETDQDCVAESFERSRKKQEPDEEGSFAEIRIE